MEPNKQSTVYEFAGGELVVWVDPGGAICIKTDNAYNDPVELGSQQARELAELLAGLVRDN